MKQEYEKDKKDDKCNKDNEDNKEKWSVLFLLLILLIFIIIITVIIIFKIRSNSRNTVNIVVSNENISGGVGLVIDPDAENSTSYDDTEEQGVAISGCSSMTIPANKDKIGVDFYNPEENAGLYYLTFELRLYSNNRQGYEVLYTSGLVEPGKRIEQITISHGLEEGVYEAVVHVQPYRMNEEKTLTNNADMKIALIVK